jgi:hypothetical protein
MVDHLARSEAFDAAVCAVWRAQVLARWPTDTMMQCAVPLLVGLAEPVTLVIEPNPSATLRVLRGLQLLRPVGLARLLAKLVDAGLLVRPAGAGRDEYALALPGPQTRAAGRWSPPGQGPDRWPVAGTAGCSLWPGHGPGRWHVNATTGRRDAAAPGRWIGLCQRR